MTTNQRKTKFRGRRKRGDSGLITHTLTLPQTKWMDVSYANIGISDAGHFTALFNPALGTGNGARLNNRILALRFEAHLVFAPSATDGNNLIRILVGDPFTTEVDSSDCPTVATAPYIDMFKVMHDEVIPLHSIENSNDGPGVVKRFRVFRYSYRKVIQFYGNQGHEVSTPVPFFYTVSDSSVVPNPTVDGFIRCYYTDLF